MAFRLRLPSKNTFGFPENRVADSRCDLPRFASRLDLVAKNDFRVSRKLRGRNPKIVLSHEASSKKWTGSVITTAGVVPGKRPVPAKPNEVASELFQDAQNFRPGDGYLVQFDSQAGLALDTARSADNGRGASQRAHHGLAHFVVRLFAVLASWPCCCKARHAGSID